MLTGLKVETPVPESSSWLAGPGLFSVGIFLFNTRCPWQSRLFLVETSSPPVFVPDRQLPGEVPSKSLVLMWESTDS